MLRYSGIGGLEIHKIRSEWAGANRSCYLGHSFAMKIILFIQSTTWYSFHSTGILLVKRPGSKIKLVRRRH